jgi:hypothetical protein
MTQSHRYMLLALCFCILFAGCYSANQKIENIPPSDGRRLVARTYNSGFDLAHDTYNGMGVASDGRIYYVLSSAVIERGGQVYCYEPAGDKIRHLGDLTKACGGADKSISQGKSHVNFVESNGKLYFASNIGYYSI